MITREDLQAVLVFATAGAREWLAQPEDWAAIGRVQAELDAALPPDVTTVVWTRNSDPVPTLTELLTSECSGGVHWYESGAERCRCGARLPSGGA